MNNIIVVVSVIFLIICWSDAKAGGGDRIYFTPDRITAAHENIESYEWARQEADRIMHGPALNPHQSIVADAYISAERLVEKSNDELFAMMPTITVARDDSQGKRLCPVHGEEIRKYSGYRPWKLDYENHPWKVICPVGGEMYPSNDFAAGDMTSGDYPDDGNGIVINGIRHQVVRYYAHMAYLHYVYPAIRSLAAAYVLTNEPRYAEKCAVLLASVANNYPGAKYHSQYCFKGKYGRDSGMITDSIWSGITIPRLALAYDAIRPIYNQSPQLLTYLQSKGLAASSPDEARQYVEDRLFRQAMQGLLDEAIRGNPGFHQYAAIVLALVMDDFDLSRHPNSLDMVRFAYDKGYAPTRWVMSNYVTRDGGGYEGLAYDRFKFNYINVALRMEELRARQPDLLPESQFPRILDEPKAKAMYDFYIDAASLGATMVEVGDTGGSRLNPQIMPPQFVSRFPHFYAEGYRTYREPRYARALLGLHNTMPKGSDLFEPSIEDKALAAAQLPDAQVTPSTRLLDGYGLAYLAGGQGGRRYEAVVNYTALKGHHQDDYLSLYLFANELSMLPDLGYPFTWDYRRQWDANIYTHNTVAVDGTSPFSPPTVPRGWVSLIGDAAGVQVSLIAHDCYNLKYRTRHSASAEGKDVTIADRPNVNRYERMTVMIGENDSDAYMLDLFMVDGGIRHDQSWHSVLQSPSLPDLSWHVQKDGTAAGESVGFDQSYVNVRGKEVKDGLCYVTNVKKAQTSNAAMFEWDFALKEPAGLRLHVVPVDRPVELIYGKGRSPARPKDWGLPLLFVRHEGKEGLESRFLTLLEPYRGDATQRITSVHTQGEGWPLTVTVGRGSEQDIITIYCPSNGEMLTRGSDRNAGVRVRTQKGNKVTRDVQFGSLAQSDSGIIRSQITSLNRDERTITIAKPAADLVNTQPWVRIYSPGRSSMYRVMDITQIDGGRSQLTLKETSLLSRAMPMEYARGKIINKAPLPFATGQVDSDGNYIAHTCRFEGARIENTDSSVSWRLAGVSGEPSVAGTEGFDLFLEEPVSPKGLEEAFGSAGPKAVPISLYDYGKGDSVELLCVMP